MATTQSILEILIQAVDESAAALTGAQNNLQQVGQQALMAGTQLAVMGAALEAAYGGIVYSAAGVQESQDSLQQAVTDAMAGAGTSTQSYATQVAFLQDKINGYKSSIDEANAALDKNTGTTEAVAAAHAKAATDIATDQVNMAKYQQQLDMLTNSQNLNGQSASAIVAQLEAQATANVSLGFSVEDSTNSLKQAFTATKSVSDAMQVNQAAMDLARAKNLDLGTATNQVILAMEGQGRALATYGIQIKDGLSGMDALNAVQGAVNGQAQAYAETLSGSVAVAMQSFNKLLSDMGSTQLPMLTQFLGVLVQVIDAVDNWTQKHQKLTETIILFVGILGGLVTLLGSLLVIFGTVAIAVALLGGPFTLLIGLVALLAAVIIANWQSIEADIEAIWESIKGFFTTTWNWIKALFDSSMSAVAAAWNDGWTLMGDMLTNTWATIKNTVKSGVNDIISGINIFINALDSLHINIPAITIPGTKLGTPAVDLGFSIPDIPMLAAGGVVYNPVLAMIGEQGPEAVMPLSSLAGAGGGFGGQQINIYIQGGNYLDKNGATLIGNALAKQILTQIRVKNYQS
jgi:phage-related minor tail protein